MSDDDHMITLVAVIDLASGLLTTPALSDQRLQAMIGKYRQVETLIRTLDPAVYGALMRKITHQRRVAEAIATARREIAAVVAEDSGGAILLKELREKLW